MCYEILQILWVLSSPSAATLQTTWKASVIFNCSYFYISTDNAYADFLVHIFYREPNKRTGWPRQLSVVNYLWLVEKMKLHHHWGPWLRQLNQSSTACIKTSLAFLQIITKLVLFKHHKFCILLPSNTLIRNTYASNVLIPTQQP